MAISWYNIRYVICFFLIAAGALGNDAFASKYPIQNFTPTEYQAGIQNIDFAQNRNLTLFVANNLGILSFNGTTWQTHDFKTGKKKRSLAFDAQANRLYVGSQGEFGYFTGDWDYVSLVDKIPEGARTFDEVWDVFLLDDAVYFCTFRGIYVYDGEYISVIERAGGLERSFMVAGKLFTQSQEGELFEVEHHKLRQPLPQQRSQEAIAGIVPQGQGYVLFYNSGHIEFTTPFGVSPIYPNLARTLAGTYVNHVRSLSDTRLVIATQTAGLFLFDPQTGKIDRISTQEGLASNACLRTFQDFSGNLWVGMQNGIALIDINSPMRLINQDLRIQGSGYEAYDAPEGTYYTTSNGIYFLAKNASRAVFLIGTEGPAYSMQRIAGALYAGHHRGLFLLQEGRARQLASTDGLWNLLPLQSHPGYVIGGTYSGLFLFRINERFELEPRQKIDGFAASTRFFEEDDNGNLWASQYYQGLYRLTLSNDLTAVQVTDVSQAPDWPAKEQIILSRVGEALYVACQSGLYQLDPQNNKLQQAGGFTEEIGDQPVYLFAQDAQNNIHVVAENKVGFFKQVSAGNYLFVPSSLYQLRYHLNNDLLNISTHSGPGVLFSANQGFIRYNPTQEAPIRENRPLVIKEVFSVTQGKALYHRPSFSGQPDPLLPLRISPRARVLTFAVESFHFTGMNNQQFRYYLQGFDEGFGAWTTANTKEYTNLREGKYTFRAQARNYLGVVTDSQVLHFTVNPPFYRSFWAKALYIVVALGLFFWVFRYQKVRYTQKADKLEADRQLELAQKQQRLNEMEQQRELDRRQLEEEKMQSELQHLNKLLAASTMNLVVKNEFIESIKEELNEVKQKGSNRETKKALEKVVKEIDVTLRLEQDWEQFQYHFEKVHGNFLTRLRADYPDLSPNEQKLCTFLRLNLSTKEIANLLSISPRGVEVARYRLRKKLNLERGDNLSKFILEY